MCTTSLRSSVLMLLLLTCPLGDVVAVGQELNDASPSGISLSHATAIAGMTSTAPQKDLRILGKAYSAGGVEVTWVDDDSPAKSMVLVQNASTRGTIEVGDVITSVNGTSVHSMRDFYEVLRSASSTVVLRVKDIRTATELDWRAPTISVVTPRVQVPPLADGTPRVHCIYAALTSDLDLGPMIERDVASFSTLVTGLIGEGRLASMTTLDGSKCTAEGIRNAIAALAIQSSDSIFFYYQGHGAYDPAHATGDRSFGHHLQLPDEGLLRRELLFRIASKRPRMTLLITDCCNVESKLKEPGHAVSELISRDISGWTSLEELLLCYRGVIDMTATSRGEFAWYDDVIGGWFTDAFSSKCYATSGHGGVNWDTFLGELSVDVDRAFLSRKSTFSDPELRAQSHMTPTVFTISIIREEPQGNPPGERTILVPVTRTLRTDSQN